MENDDYDNSQGCSTEEIQSLCKDHSNFENGTPKLSPITTPQTGTVSDEKNVSDIYVDVDIRPDQMKQEKYISISETIEENKRLKALVFNLKLDIYCLKKELPILKNADGVDYTAEFLSCKAQLDHERRAKLMSESELEAFKSKHEKEKEKWLKQEKVLTAQCSELQYQVDELRKDNETENRTIPGVRENIRESVSTCDLNASEGESSIFSVHSERDQQLEDLRRLMFVKTAETETMRRDFTKQIDALVEDLKRKDDGIKLLIESLEREKMYSRKVEDEFMHFQNSLIEFGNFKSNVGEVDQACFQMELHKRSKLVNALRLIRRYMCCKCF